MQIDNILNKNILKIKYHVANFKNDDDSSGNIGFIRLLSGHENHTNYIFLKNHLRIVSCINVRFFVLFQIFSIFFFGICPKAG